MGFPLHSNKPYIKDTGERTTLGAVIGSGGGGGTSELPEYGIGDAGKVLTVGSDGHLKWATPSSGGAGYVNTSSLVPDIVVTTSETEVTT